MCVGYDYQSQTPLPLSSQQSLKVVGFDDPLIARVPYDLYEARARDSVIRMDGSATRTPAVYAAEVLVDLRRVTKLEKD